MRDSRAASALLSILARKLCGISEQMHSTASWRSRVDSRLWLAPEIQLSLDERRLKFWNPTYSFVFLFILVCHIGE